MDYKGMKCSVCGKPFAENDDIVVCPQCGAPYHRECYAKEGKCVYADRHGTPDAWKPPQPEAGPTSEAKRCPRCGAPNAKDALFCAHCGQSLSEENESPYGNSFPYQNQGQNPGQNPNQNPGQDPSRNGWNGYPPQGGGYPPQQNGDYPPDFGFQGQPFLFPFDPLGGVNPNEPIGDIPAADLAKFVQGNTQYYIPTFLNLSHFGRNRFNFSAFFFRGIWMLYRKLYKIGAIITTLEAALLISFTFLMRYAVLPLYEKLYALAGITRDAYGYYTMTNSQQNDLLRIVSSLPVRQQFIAAAPGLYFFAAIVLMLVCGFIGNRLYLKSCVQHVSQIRSQTPTQPEFAIRLQQEGGMNTALASALTLCFLLIFMFAIS